METNAKDTESPTDIMGKKNQELEEKRFMGSSSSSSSLFLCMKEEDSERGGRNQASVCRKAAKCGFCKSHIDISDSSSFKQMDCCKVYTHMGCDRKLAKLRLDLKDRSLCNYCSIQANSKRIVFGPTSRELDLE